MKYENQDYRARATRAQKAAANLLRVVEWRIQGEPALLPAALQDGLNAPDACLVLLASGGSYPNELEEAVRETRATILIVEPGSTSRGLATFYFTLVRSVGGKVCWIRALRLWLDLERNAYLVSDGYGENPEGVCFALDACGVASVPPPWSNTFEHGFGLAHGDAVLLAP